MDTRSSAEPTASTGADARWPDLEGRPIRESPLAPSVRDQLWRQGGRFVHQGWASYEDITPELSRRGVKVVPYRIDVDEFWRYVEKSGYREMEYWQGGARATAVEKWLEHFVSLELLAPKAPEVIVDIASWESPFSDILSRDWGCRTYRQDWTYPPGIDGDRIGGDAADLPVPDHFADGLVLHCSFEHFEGDRDGGFIREAERVLRPGGRLCILPLYTNRTYCIQTDLDMWATRSPEFENDAVICVADGWGEVHGRFYDTRHFLDRVVGSLGGLELEIHSIENAQEVGKECYLRFAALIVKP